jgi:hypothetical protein
MVLADTLVSVSKLMRLALMLLAVGLMMTGQSNSHDCSD